MKSIKYLLLALSLVLFSSNAIADDGSSMLPILEKTQSIIELLENDYDEEVVHVEMDILRDEKSVIRSLYEGNSYTIAVYGDSRYKDIDVYVYRSTGPGVDDWTLVKRDNDDSSVAVVSITPESTEVYKILIKAYKYNEGYDVAEAAKDMGNLPIEDAYGISFFLTVLLQSLTKVTTSSALKKMLKELKKVKDETKRRAIIAGMQAIINGCA